MSSGPFKNQRSLFAKDMRYKISLKKPVLFVLANVLLVILILSGSSWAMDGEKGSQGLLEDGIALYKAGCYNTAIDFLEKAGQDASLKVFADINISVCLIQLGRAEEAVQVLEKAVNLAPNNVYVYYNLGIAYLKTGKNAAAVSVFKKAIKLKPEFANGVCGLAKIYEEEGNVEQAKEMYNRALRLYKNEGNENMAAILGEHLVGMGESINLEIVGNKKAESMPVTIDEIAQKSELFFQSGEYKKSEELLLEALQLDSRMPSLYYHLGLVYLRQEEYEKSLSALLEAVKLDKGYFKAYLNLGVVYGKLRYLPESVKAFKKAIELMPDSANAYYNLGKAYIIQGKVEEAKKPLKKALALSQDQGLIELTKQIEDLFTKLP